MLRTTASLLAVCSAHAAAQPCDWTLKTSPNPGGRLILYGMDADGSGQNLWTVGQRQLIGSGDAFNYAARWDGTAWVQTNIPQPSTLRDYQGLSAVLSLGPDDAIAAGTFNPPAGSSQGQAMRWDGSEWSLMNTPTYAGGSSFFSLGTAGPDVWMGGGKYSELPPPAALTFPFAARLDGDDWNVVFVPPLAETGGRSYNFINAIGGVAADDAWAVGDAQEVGVGGFGPAAMIVRWDGSEWTQYDAFPLVDDFFSGLTDLATIASDDAWAVGYDYDNARQQTVPLILHWDGSAWTKAAVPTFPDSAELRAVAAVGPNAVYAAGTRADANGFPHALILRWDGTAWTEVPGDNLDDFGTWYRSAAVAEGTVWVGGQANFLNPGITQRREPCDTGCPADFNTDGSLNFFDVSGFIDAFNAQDPATDLTGDGLFNFFDISGYLDLYAAGCP